MFGSLPLLAFLLGFTLGSNLPRLSAAGRAFIRREYYTTGARGKQDRKGGAGAICTGSKHVMGEHIKKQTDLPEEARAVSISKAFANEITI